MELCSCSLRWSLIFGLGWNLLGFEDRSDVGLPLFFGLAHLLFVLATLPCHLDRQFVTFGHNPFLLGVQVLDLRFVVRNLEIDIARGQLQLLVHFRFDGLGQLHSFFALRLAVKFPLLDFGQSEGLLVKNFWWIGAENFGAKFMVFCGFCWEKVPSMIFVL